MCLCCLGEKHSRILFDQDEAGSDDSAEWVYKKEKQKENGKKVRMRTQENRVSLYGLITDTF
ncbi:hypothetical protein ES703_124621 [subsurface metagenome]